MAIQMPIGMEDSFTGIVDLVRQKAIIYHDDLGQEIEETDIPPELAEEAKKMLNDLIEAIAETDEDLMEKYLENEDLSVEDIKAGLRRATLAVKIVPVLCGSSFKNKGVQQLLDAIVDYLPAPTDLPGEGINPDTGQEETRCL